MKFVILSEIRRYISRILVEGKVDDLKAKHHDDAALIDKLASRDPSGKQKYLPWMLKQIKAGAKFEDVTPSVEFFHNSVQRFPVKDINAYKTAKELEDKVKELSSKKSKGQMKSDGAEKVFEDDKRALFYIRNKNACMAYGSGTKWCITMKGATYWDEYVGRGVLFYFLINKTLPQDNPMSKVAFATHLNLQKGKEEGSSQIDFELYDAEDDQIDPAQHFIDIQNIIRKHAPTAPPVEIDEKMLVINGSKTPEEAVAFLSSDRVNDLSQADMMNVMTSYGDNIPHSGWLKALRAMTKTSLKEVMLGKFYDRSWFIEYALNDEDSIFRSQIMKKARTARIPDSKLLKFIDDESAAVRIALVNAFMDKKHLRLMMDDPHTSVRVAVARMIPAEFLPKMKEQEEALLNDPNGPKGEKAWEVIKVINNERLTKV